MTVVAHLVVVIALVAPVCPRRARKALTVVSGVLALALVVGA